MPVKHPSPFLSLSPCATPGLGPVLTPLTPTVPLCCALTNLIVVSGFFVVFFFPYLFFSFSWKLLSIKDRVQIFCGIIPEHCSWFWFVHFPCSSILLTKHHCLHFTSERLVRALSCLHSSMWSHWCVNWVQWMLTNLFVDHELTQWGCQRTSHLHYRQDPFLWQLERNDCSEALFFVCS